MYQCTAKEQLRSVDLALHPQLGLAPEPGNLEDTGMETNSRPGLLRQFFFLTPQPPFGNCVSIEISRLGQKKFHHIIHSTGLPSN